MSPGRKRVSAGNSLASALMEGGAEGAPRGPGSGLPAGLLSVAVGGAGRCGPHACEGGAAGPDPGRRAGAGRPRPRAAEWGCRPHMQAPGREPPAPASPRRAHLRAKGPREASRGQVSVLIRDPAL